MCQKAHTVCKPTYLLSIYQSAPFFMTYKCHWWLQSMLRSMKILDESNHMTNRNTVQHTLQTPSSCDGSYMPMFEVRTQQMFEDKLLTPFQAN